MEKLTVSIIFLIGSPEENGLDKVKVTVKDFVNQEKTVEDIFDLLPSYPLENYVRFELTKFNQRYGTKEITQIPPQK